MKYNPEDILKIMKMIYNCTYGEIIINVNDTFVYGSDSEEIDLKDWISVAECFDLYGYSGVNAWISLKRGYDVLPKRQCADYWNAKQYLINKRKVKNEN